MQVLHTERVFLDETRARCWVIDGEALACGYTDQDHLSKQELNVQKSYWLYQECLLKCYVITDHVDREIVQF